MPYNMHSKSGTKFFKLKSVLPNTCILLDAPITCMLQPALWCHLVTIILVLQFNLPTLCIIFKYEVSDESALTM